MRFSVVGVLLAGLCSTSVLCQFLKDRFGRSHRGYEIERLDDHDVTVYANSAFDSKAILRLQRRHRTVRILEVDWDLNTVNNPLDFGEILQGVCIWYWEMKSVRAFSVPYAVFQGDTATMEGLSITMEALGLPRASGSFHARNPDDLHYHSQNGDGSDQAWDVWEKVHRMAYTQMVEDYVTSVSAYHRPDNPPRLQAVDYKGSRGGLTFELVVLGRGTITFRPGRK